MSLKLASAGNGDGVIWASRWQTSRYNKSEEVRFSLHLYVLDSRVVIECILGSSF